MAPFSISRSIIASCHFSAIISLLYAVLRFDVKRWYLLSSALHLVAVNAEFPWCFHVKSQQG
jgi:hypothetical protein